MLKLIIYHSSYFPPNISIDFGLLTELYENCVLLVYNTHHRQTHAGLHTSCRVTSGISESPQMVSKSSPTGWINNHTETLGNPLLAPGITVTAGHCSCHLFQWFFGSIHLNPETNLPGIKNVGSVFIDTRF